MEDKVNVICMKWGEKYDSSYVNILYNMVDRNLKRPFRFVCLTDNKSGLSNSIESFDLPSLNLPKGIPERGWMKISTFASNLHDLSGKTLFLDLDLVIINNIDAFFEQPGDFLIIKDFRKKNFIGNSSVYRFEIGKYYDVLEHFRENFEKIKTSFRNEQEFLSDYMKKNHSLEYWPEDWCKSFKKDCVEKGLKQFFKPPKIPSSSKIIIFHGKPNPPDAMIGKSGKWYRKVLPTPWIKDNWR